MTKMTTGRPGLRRPPKQPLPSEHAAPRPIASSSTGNASWMSMMRESTESIQPR